MDIPNIDEATEEELRTYSRNLLIKGTSSGNGSDHLDSQLSDNKEEDR